MTLQPYTDQKLLGGAVLRLGDTVFDGSLLAGLNRLGQQMRQGPSPRPVAAATKTKNVKAKSKVNLKPIAKAKKKPVAKKTAAKKVTKKAVPKKAAKKSV